MPSLGFPRTRKILMATIMVKGLEHLSLAVMPGALGLLSLEKTRLGGYIQWISGRELSKQEYPIILSVSEHIFNQDFTGFHSTVYVLL